MKAEVREQLKKIAGIFCEKYCKYPDIYDEEEEGVLLEESDICRSCPFNTLEPKERSDTSTQRESRYMTLDEAHYMASHGDRELLIKGIMRGFWGCDHILNYVIKHGKNKCEPYYEDDKRYCVKMLEGDKNEDLKKN